MSLALDLVPKGRKFCAVLKADAYGHGIAQIVPLIMAQGVGCVGITSNSEAYAVRDAGFEGDLIRLRAATPTEIDDALDAGVEEQVASVGVAEKLRSLKRAGHSVRAHLGLNALGMSRDGLEISTLEGREALSAILDILPTEIVGICTHFPDNTPIYLRQSAKLFQEQVDWIFANSRLVRSQICVHAGSSLTLVSSEAVETDMYRCGAILYGILKPDLGFRTSMDLKARVVSVADYPKGAPVGYDRACHLDADRRLACISIGYADGFRRGPEEGASVAIGDHLVPIMGKVSMNTIVVDVTGLREVDVGDEVVVFGESPDANRGTAVTEGYFRTIIADLFADWGQRNQRIFR